MPIKKASISLYMLGVMLLFWSCEKNDPFGPQQLQQEATDNNDSLTFEKGVYIVNEGNFQRGNASLTYYNRQQDTLIHRLFAQQNNRPLGDVFQSIYIYKENAFLVVNNSQKIEKVSLAHFQSLQTLNTLTSPRYIEIINGHKAYVTDLYGNQINIFNPSTMTKKGNISVRGWTESIVSLNNNVFVLNKDSSRILKIDPSQNKILQRRKIAKSPNSMVIDKNGKIWVLCDGGLSNKYYPHLLRLSSSLAIEASFSFDSKSSRPDNLIIDEQREVLYYINKGIYRFPIQNNALPGQTLFPPGNKNFYALGYDTAQHEIYAADARDYQQKGVIYRIHPSTGAFIDSFQSGYIPSDFAFR